eukprot:3487832-Rhodomonas_salina.2
MDLCSLGFPCRLDVTGGRFRVRDGAHMQCLESAGCEAVSMSGTAWTCAAAESSREHALFRFDGTQLVLSDSQVRQCKHVVLPTA